MKTLIAAIAALSIIVPAQAQISLEAHAPVRMALCWDPNYPPATLRPEPALGTPYVLLMCDYTGSKIGHTHSYVGLMFDGAACDPWLLWFEGANVVRIYCHTAG